MSEGRDGPPECHHRVSREGVVRKETESEKESSDLGLTGIRMQSGKESVCRQKSGLP